MDIAREKMRMIGVKKEPASTRYVSSNIGCKY